ncbi:hypothetical protein [Falsiruegeria mediterranea]
MRQVSLTHHRYQPSTLWIDGKTIRVDGPEQIGKALRDAGIHAEQRINMMTARGKTDMCRAGYFLVQAPEPAKKRRARK